MPTEAEKAIAMNTVISSTHDQIQKLLAEMSKAKDALSQTELAARPCF
jgi:hypothetical protein